MDVEAGGVVAPRGGDVDVELCWGGEDGRITPTCEAVEVWHAPKTTVRAAAAAQVRAL